jgi:hypothetical protein
MGVFRPVDGVTTNRAPTLPAQPLPFRRKRGANSSKILREPACAGRVADAGARIACGVVTKS